MAWSVAALATLGVALAALVGVQRRRDGAVRRAGPNAAGAAEDGGESQDQPITKRPEPPALKSCPVCLSEYPTVNRFCVRDGAQLSEAGVSGPFSQGMICPTCRRGYPFDSSFCPEDADELVPYGLYGAASSTRPPLRLDANKICPECGVRHAPAHLFCGEDGSELVVVN
jgi:hypothetical protein